MSGRVAVVIALAAAVLALPSSGLAWTSLGTLSATSEHRPLAPAIAIAPTGNTVVTWRRQDGASQFCCFRIQGRRISKSKTLGPVVTLSPAGQFENASQPELALSSQGDAYVVWTTVPQDCGFSDCPPPGEYGWVKGRLWRANGSLGPVETLSQGPFAGGPHVRFDGAGNALVAWERYLPAVQKHRVELRKRTSLGGLGSVEPLSSFFVAPTYPSLGVSQNGDAYVTWTANRECADLARIQGRSRLADGTLGPIQAISGPGIAPDSLVGIDDDGDAVVAWRDNCAGPSVARILVRPHSAAGELGPVRAISAPDATQYFRLGVDDAGDAVVAWNSYEAPDHPLSIRTRHADGTLGALQTLTDMGAIQDLAVNGSGASMIVWLKNGLLYAERRSATDELSPAQRLFTTAHRKSAVAALGDTGLARIAFEQCLTGACWTVGATADP